MKRTSLTVLFLSILLASSASESESERITASYQSIFSTGNELPFWMVHNQSGKYPLNTNSAQLVSLQGKHFFENIADTPLSARIGTNFISSYGNAFDFHFNELYGKLFLWNWKLEAGLFKETEYYNHLSSTNGHIDRSNNNRPYPRIRLATNEFIPFIFWKKWFRFKAEYDEGILNDERVVENTRLHHKSLYFKTIIKSKVHLSLGLNHYVMWGGISPVYGELPNTLKDYITYVSGQPGNSNFPETDQLNYPGNQLGSYHLQIDFPVKNIGNFSLYLSHPFEDKSGMELDNRRDNLYGIFYDTKRNGIISKVVYEHMYTIHQSGHIHQYGVMRGRDNYFNHGYYRTGFTYMGYAMCSPLFSPVVTHETNQAILNNRIAMHHIAMMGNITQKLKWSAKLTWSRNLGTYNNPFDDEKHQITSILNFDYHPENFPLTISMSSAADYGQLYEKRTGVMIKLSKSW
jgi:hypothetical protein